MRDSNPAGQSVQTKITREFLVVYGTSGGAVTNVRPSVGAGRSLGVPNLEKSFPHFNNSNSNTIKHISRNTDLIYLSTIMATAAATASTAGLPHRSATKASGGVSYEVFAPRSSAQVSRLSRIAALTEGPTALATTNKLPKAPQESSLQKAMSPPDHDQPQQPDSASLQSALIANDQLTHTLQQALTLRLALHNSIRTAEDISNRHAALIRHSGELSAAAERLQQERTLLQNHAAEIGRPLQHYNLSLIHI